MAKLLADCSTLPCFATPRPVSIKEAIKIKCTILFKSPEFNKHRQLALDDEHPQDDSKLLLIPEG